MNSELIKEKYQIVRELHGDHGIYLVQNVQDQNVYVLKILSVFNIDVFKLLQDNPVKNIPEIVEMWQDGELLYVAEKFISGKNLRDILDEQGTLQEKEAQRIALGVCDVVGRLHRLNPPVIHRDIKPSNVIVADDGEVWLIDLNASKLADFSKGQDTVLLGTQGYAAPEQYGFGPSGPQTDIYMIGVTLNEILTGKLPAQERHTGKFAKVIDKCLQMDSRYRYINISELEMGLKQALHATTSDPEVKSGDDNKKIGWKYFLPVGFRSGKAWKIILAVLMYVVWFTLGLGLTVKGSNVTMTVLWVNRIFFIITGLAMLGFSCNYGNIWKLT